MFTYLQAIRPNNRRSALPSTTAPQPGRPTRYYHEAPSYTVNASGDHVPSSVFYEESPSLPSPVASDRSNLPTSPRNASRDDLGRLREDQGGTKQELIPTEGLSVEKKRPWLMLSRSIVGEKTTVHPATKDESHRNLSPTLQPPPRSFVFHDQIRDQRLRPLNSPYDRINSSFESSQSHPRPNSAGNLALMPQPGRAPPPPPIQLSQQATSGGGQARHSKAKLHLLNPMSLLARRRSSQATTEVSDKHIQVKSPSIPGVNLPDDYDPRIRGKVVHDFSAPRPGHGVSSIDGKVLSADSKNIDDSEISKHSRSSPNPNLVSLPDADSPERQHTPIFKEHFDDDVKLKQSDPEGLANLSASALMYQLSLNDSYSDPDSCSLPPFARNLASRLSKATEGGHTASPISPKPSLEVVLEGDLAQDPSSEKSAKASPPNSPPKSRSRASSSADSPFQTAGLPRRFKSNASRFSFDLAGVGSSAQEKLLEERHREKARQKLRESGASGVTNVYDTQNDADDNGAYSESDYDDIDDDDDLEERIPGVNADADDSMSPVSLPAIDTISPTNLSFTSPVSPLSDKLASTEIPAQTLPMQGQESSYSSAISQDTNIKPQESFALKYTVHSSKDSLGDVENAHDNPLLGLPFRSEVEDDDLYFDDGLIEDLENRDGQTFDESLFDDDTSRIYGLPLRDLKPQSGPTKTAEAQEQQSPLANDCFTSPQGVEGIGAEEKLGKIQSRDSFVDFNHDFHPAFSQGAGLTEDNLAAYHGALAHAANQAAMNGEFDRRLSLSRNFNDGQLHDLESAPAMTPDDGRASQEIDALFCGQGIDGTEDFDFDDTLSDDPIIAAANAEALENDDDGFYGQEFGFFANGTGSAEYANGGYFGPRGVEGIGRSHSGRVNFQEPSLTPITERSEWSNRNSAISLAMLGYPQSVQQQQQQQPLPSPGLAQLADMMAQGEDDNMSLSALMKLRRGAWGDSSTSLHSSSGGQISPSPLNLPNPFSSLNPVPASNPAIASTFSLASSNGFNSSDSDASPSSPTVTVTAHTGIPPPPTVTSPRLENTPPARPQLRKNFKGHTRGSSGGGAESVSYVHERDGEGGRWVVEKRRVGEGGRVEVLGREVLQGGRI